MTYKRFKDRVIVRLMTGEEIIESLTALARIEKIPSAALMGLGALGDVTLAFYNLQTRQYQPMRLQQDLELVSLTGNIGWLADDPAIHAHAVVSRDDGTAAGGHVMRGVVSASVEMMLTLYPERLIRAHEPEIGLNLLQLG